MPKVSQKCLEANKEGVRLFKAGDYPAAIKCFSIAISEYPEGGIYYSNRADAYYYAADAKKAIEDANHALRLGNLPESQKVRMREIIEGAEEFSGAMSKSRLSSQIVGYITDGWHSDILELLQGKSESFLASDRMFYVGLAIGKQAVGQNEEALLDIQKAVRLFPDFGMAWGQLGSVQMDLKNYREALDAYEKAKAFDSEDFHLAGQAACWANLGEYDAAEKIYGKILAADATDANAFCNRANVRFAQKKYREALEDFNQALAILLRDKKYPNRESLLGRCRSGRAVTKAEMGRYDAAIEELSALLKDKGDAAVFLAHRAECYRLTKQYEKALKDTKKALKIDEKQGKARRVRGRVYHDQGDYKNALRHYDKLLGINPENVMALMWRAETYIACKDLGKAIKDYEAVTKIGSATREQQDEARQQMRALARQVEEIQREKRRQEAEQERERRKHEAEEEASEKVVRELDRLERGIGQMSMKDLNRAFRKIERDALREDPGRFYELRGFAEYNAAGKVEIATQKEAMQTAALKYYRKALEEDSSCTQAARRIEELEKILKPTRPSVAIAMPMFGGGKATPQLTPEQEAAVAKRMAEMRKQMGQGKRG